MASESIFLILLFFSLIAGILSGVPVMLAIAGVPLLVALLASLFGAFDLQFLWAYPARVWGIMSNGLLMAVPLFILMGLLLERAQLAEKMLLIMSRLLGSSGRGLALSVLLISLLIAAATGIIGATIVMLGLMSLPALLRSGLSPRLSSGLICASGTLGQIIPPSIVLVLLGDQVGNVYMQAQQAAGNFAPEPVSVGDLFAGAMFPGLLLVGLYALYLLLVTEPDDTVSEPVNKPTLVELLGTFLPPLMLIVTVLGSILSGVATITEAASVGAVGTLLLAAYQMAGSVTRRWLMLGVGAIVLLLMLQLAGLSRLDMTAASVQVTPMQWLGAGAAGLFITAVFIALWQLLHTAILFNVLLDTVKMTAMVFGIIIAASLLALVFRGFGGDEKVHEFLAALPGDQWGALAFVLLLIFLLGFILEVVEIIYIVIPLVGPVLLAGDFNPVWFAVLVAMILQTSFLTPPFGFALFYFRSVAPAELRSVDIYLAVIPFVLLQLLATGILIAMPGLVTWLPAQLF